MGVFDNETHLKAQPIAKRYIRPDGGVAGGVKGDDNIWTQFTPKSTMGGVDCSSVAYFRINAAYIGDDSIITVNEPIV